jgi:hypothetical protein
MGYPIGSSDTLVLEQTSPRPANNNRPHDMNRLATQTSPYLLQHADNPVDWQPWDEQALQRARDQDKPILLSIGYSACHWCHVMAHESFEDEATAALMNEHFVNIKVDREERPDLDKIYQNAHAMLTQRPGGWPLTAFLTPDDHMPIFIGTYFPNQPRHGLPSFAQLLENIALVYASRRPDIDKQSDALRDAYRRISDQQEAATATLGALPLDIAHNQIEKQFDSLNGGFSGAPKFPHPAIIERALRHWAKTAANSRPDPRILHTAMFSLERMASGGLFDHLGGGFYRYSTDELWMIPHFEKMLYDNGPLLALSAQAACISGQVEYIEAATETADWVLREMQSSQGGYYSALDADSEGIEGKFYVWSPVEIREVLAPDRYSLFERRFGLDRPANFEDHWHLHAYETYDAVAESFDTDADSVRQNLTESRKQLFHVREQRTHPGLDNKILTAWNALMIRGMSIAGRLLNRPEYLDSAQRAADFLLERMWVNHRLLASCKEHDAAHLNAYLDDYAYLLCALLELLQSRWNSEQLAWATDIADVLIEQFEDGDYGGFYFTSHDHEQLIQRTRSFADDATPSGNGFAALGLQRLGYLLAEPRYLDAAERCLKAAWHSLNQAPISHCSLLDALEEHLNPPQIIILRGSTTDLLSWQGELTGRYMPSTLVFAMPADAVLDPRLADKKPIGDVCAYSCQGTRCSPPVTSIDAWRELLDKASSTLSR